MNILIVTQLFYPDTVGGSERVVFEQGREFVARGHRVVVVTPRVRSSLPVRENISGMEVRRYGSSFITKLVGQSLSDLWHGKKFIRRLLASEKFDAAILHHPYPAAAFFKSQIQDSKFKIQSVYVFHASVWRELVLDRKYGGIHHSVIGRLFGFVTEPLFLLRTKRVEASVLKRATKIVVLSEFSRRILSETFGQAGERAIKIPGGVDLDVYRPHPNPAALRDRLGLPRGVPIALTVRRLVPRMGLVSLVRAWTSVLRAVPNALLLIGGEGPEAARVRAEIKKHGLDANVRLLGFIPIKDLADFYAAADVYVLPTIAFEGFGLTVLESLASGTPVVGTPAGAIPELLEPFDPSLLAREVSETALADALIAFFQRGDMPDLRHRARTYAETFPWSSSTDALLIAFSNS